MKLRLSYKNGLKGTVLTLISMHGTIKKFPQAPYNLLKCLAGWGLPWGSSDIWLKRVVSHKRVRFSGLVSKLEYKFFQSVFWTGDGLKVGGPWSGFIVLTIKNPILKSILSCVKRETKIYSYYYSFCLHTLSISLDCRRCQVLFATPCG